MITIQARTQAKKTYHSKMSELSTPITHTEPRTDGEDLVRGDWFWVKSDREEDDDSGNGKWLACITKLGSNYARMTSPYGGSSRIHLDSFDDTCRPEPNYKEVIAANIARCRRLVRENIEAAKELTARLGVGPRLAIPNAAGEESSRALSTVSRHQDIGQYKRDLIAAKDDQLPAIFQAIKDANKELGHWMASETLPLQAEAESMQGAVEVINDRIFHVGLYAGLAEEAKQVRRGNPAPIDTKLHVMQRQCYMDEECVAGYKAGGIDFKNLSQFDRWLARKENFERILPFPRTAVAFRVRREKKHREWDGTLGGAFIDIQLSQLDSLTFLYVRNGKQLWRIQTEHTFGDKLFPDDTELDFSEPMWAAMFASKVDNIIGDREYQSMINDLREKQAVWDAWEKEHPHKPGKRQYNPHGGMSRPSLWHHYEPFNDTSLYFDDISKVLEKRITDYNRVSVILQGLFDRSSILHPHPPVKLWTPGGFETAVRLIRDKDRTLHFGDPPDFEAYRARCNASLAVDSVTVGQHDFWLLREGERECQRLDNDWRSDSTYRPERYNPHGDPGPGFLARIAAWKPRARKAVYRWQRERRDYKRWWRDDEETLPASVTVPADELLNVDAYKPGDFNQFYQDPRTRSKYLKWAEFLIAAEEYHAGNLEPGK